MRKGLLWVHWESRGFSMAVLWVKVLAQSARFVAKATPGSDAHLGMHSGPRNTSGFRVQGAQGSEGLGFRVYVDWGLGFRVPYRDAIAWALPSSCNNRVIIRALYKYI